jgi:hypothetical protein
VCVVVKYERVIVVGQGQFVFANVVSSFAAAQSLVVKFGHFSVEVVKAAFQVVDASIALDAFDLQVVGDEDGLELVRVLVGSPHCYRFKKNQF